MVNHAPRNSERQPTDGGYSLWEILSLICSIAFFAALVSVLRESEGKEPTKWLYNRLTLNGLIALLTTFMRATMMASVAAGLSQGK
jgi:hypothetical protein